MPECIEYHMHKNPRVGDLVWHYYLCKLTGPFIITNFNENTKEWELCDAQSPGQTLAKSNSLRIPIVRRY